MKIGDLIFEARTKIGATQRDLADRVGCSPGSIAVWESGQQKPSVRNRLLLADVLQIPHHLMVPEFLGEPGAAVLVTEPDLKEIVKAYRALPPRRRTAMRLAFAMASDDEEEDGTDHESLKRA